MFQHMADAMRLDIKDPLAKWLLVTLCDFANDAGECWPSTATLAKRTGMHRASVARKLNDLEADGYLTRIKGQFNSNHYRVAVSNTSVAQSDTSDAESDTNLPLTNKEPRRVAILIPEDWTASPELRAEVAKIPNIMEIDHDLEEIEFRDYWSSRKTKRVSWDSTYKTFMRRFRTRPDGVRRVVEGGRSTANGNRRPNEGDSQSRKFSTLYSNFS